MKETTIKALNVSIEEMLKHEESSIQKYIFDGLTDQMTAEQIYATMITNCLSLSVKLSAQVVLSLLEESGILQIDEREAEKLLLKHLSNQLSE